MNFVHEALRNHHKDQLVWIMGADPSVADFPRDFLEDKLSIVIGGGYTIFQNGTYNYNNELKLILGEYSAQFPNFLAKQQIWAYPFYGVSRSESSALIVKHKPSRVWFLNYSPYPPRGHRPDMMTDLMPNAMIDLVAKANQGDPGPYGGAATCLHCALYVAIIMGCNPINIIGCSHRLIDGRQYPVEISKEPFPIGAIPRFESLWRPYAERGTQAIIEGCRRVGITVNRFIGHQGAQAAIQYAEGG